jgi:hypothetical protein
LVIKIGEFEMTQTERDAFYQSFLEEEAQLKKAALQVSPLGSTLNLKKGRVQLDYRKPRRKNLAQLEGSERD